MGDIVRTKQVFVAGGMPSITYVDRTAQNLERRLKAEIQDGFKVICVTGPTKSGKTVLTRHTLGRKKSALVNGGQVESPGEFWIGLLQELELPDQQTQNEAQEDSVGLRSLLTVQHKLQEGATVTFSNGHKNSLLRYLRDRDLALVVDDFHYMPEAVQREVIRSLKSEIFEGLVAILIAVPHRAFDAIGVEREMEGRFAHIEIPVWSEEELLQISNKGFPELNILMPDAICETFANEANGSPLLMQRFCGRVCNHYEIEEKLSSERSYVPSDATLEEIFRTVAQQFGLPTFQKLAKGPQSRSKRIDRSRLNGQGNMDIYQAVLAAVANTGPKSKIHYNEIRDQLKSVLVEADLPQKHEVSNALSHMSGIAKDKIEGEPVIEWADDHLYITDPFLMFYMRWAQRTG